MEDSFFTKIIRGDIPCHKVYEDDVVIAFLDIHPQVEGHTLVVPKVQVDHLWDLDDTTYAHLWRVAKHLALNMRAQGLRARTSAVVAGYGVPHAHIHLIPIADENELKQPQDTTTEPNHTALAAMAQRLSIKEEI
ncbi:HIT domain-containing protein [Candidatus Saccharibacteria bacterium]|jgi:histidine triad (HIT) family protein|nr:HIT domain-containing protein [Candidatus Saccharibacteria bacterium]HPR09318.1 HIT domain-containing protein [Candidatus Saccharibacteria bacterium]